MNGLGVIFDMDGVLVDSYAAHYKSWQLLGREAGFEMSEEQFFTTFGRTSREIIRDFWPHLAASDDQVAALDQQKEVFFREILRTNFPAMDGARELIDDLAGSGYALAVGSSGPPENVQLILEKLERGSLFRAVVTGMDVTRGKPDPQVFALCAERLGIAPANCLVVEDAAVGVAAALAAGCRCIGLANRGQDAALLGAADLVIHRLRELSAQRIASLFGDLTRR